MQQRGGSYAACFEACFFFSSSWATCAALCRSFSSFSFLRCSFAAGPNFFAGVTGSTPLTCTHMSSHIGAAATHRQGDRACLRHLDLDSQVLAHRSNCIPSAMPHDVSYLLFLFFSGVYWMRLVDLHGTWVLFRKSNQKCTERSGKVGKRHTPQRQQSYPSRTWFTFNFPPSSWTLKPCFPIPAQQLASTVVAPVRQPCEQPCASQQHSQTIKNRTSRILCASGISQGSLDGTRRNRIAEKCTKGSSTPLLRDHIATHIVHIYQKYDVCHPCQ
jgi:hypothetical protein